MNRLIKLFILFIFVLLCCKTYAQEVLRQTKNVLFINSYAPTYSWGDSVSKGIINTFKERNDITLYVEYLDAKRFGQTFFLQSYKMLAEKYNSLEFDICITSDNDALEFLFQYGNELVPDIPVIFCGINNPEDYELEESRFYGISESIDQDSVNKLVLKILPDAEFLYYIYDSTTTSLLNINYVKEIEPEYSNRVKFKYVTGFAVDSLPSIVKQFNKKGAIVLVNVFQDIDNTPVNSDIVFDKIANTAPIPLFMDSETSVGKGMAGGIINKGTEHGNEAARLALEFLDNPDYKPEKRVLQPEYKYYFDYRVLKKFNIDINLLPSNSILINKPDSIITKYLLYFLILFVVMGLLISIILILSFNIRKRKKAENLVTQKLNEIQEINTQLIKANQLEADMNARLEDKNRALTTINKELEIAKRKSDESDRLKSAFLSNMSHEIRTPLNSVVGFSDLIAERETTKEEQERFAKLIKSNSEQLLRLINDILDISRTETGEIAFEKKSILVQDVFIELKNSFQVNNKKNEVEIRIDEDSMNTNLVIYSDPVRFKQVLTNLIQNAIKFTNKGYVEFGYKLKNPNEATFYVKDTGIGIDKSHHDKVFDRFWRIEDSKTSLYPGTGLGLSIAKLICEKLGGHIWFDSKTDLGTTFYFTHPLEDQSIKKPILRTTKDKNLDSAIDKQIYDKETLIAIVEDEQDNQNLLKQLLSIKGFKTISFYNGIEICEFLKNNHRHNIQLILMDIKMPGLDGFQTTRIIKEKHPEIPIIAQTAYALENDINKIKQASFDSYLTKPIKKSMLYSKIYELIHK
ncbi:MAG: response regulator [Bacteroidales bacterium]|nr:response regulator [Bacteroidales bacterium]MBN2817767.1 response regulator [Bacteroidales bacterium]